MGDGLITSIYLWLENTPTMLVLRLTICLNIHPRFMHRISLLITLLCATLSTQAQVQIKHYTCWNGFEVSEGDTIHLNTDIPSGKYTAIYKDKVFGKNEYLITADKESYVVVRNILRLNAHRPEETAHLSVNGKHISKYTLEVDKAIDSNEILMPEGFVGTPRKPDSNWQYTTRCGTTYEIGDAIIMGKGSAPKGKFMYLRSVSYREPEFMYSQAFNPTSIQTYAYSFFTGRKCYIQKIHYYKMNGERKVYFVVAMARWKLSKFVLDIENAITMEEVLVDDKP